MNIMGHKLVKLVNMFLLLLACVWWVGCEDKYIYDDKEPDFLGASIYDFMVKDGRFTNFLRLIDDLDYREVLSRTGSKTLFPARDDAFERFYRSNNAYGVSKYDDFTPAQKRNIMNVSMLNMAYLTYMLANVAVGGDNNESKELGEGLAIRKSTANTFMDSIPYNTNEKLFAANRYWERFQSRGLYLIGSEAAAPLVYFTASNMQSRGISNDDFSTLFNGVPYTPDDIYINGIPMMKNENGEKNRDVICKNGYVHVMSDLLFPPQSMADVISTNGETDLFSRLMDKFSMPYYLEDISKAVHVYYDGSSPERPLIAVTDSVFVTRYITESFNTDQTGRTLTNYGLLYYDPAAVGYGGETDMGVMFVPTNQALNDYINSGNGSYLKDAYPGGWDDIPTSLLALFLKNHQKKSFLNSLPHAWPEMNDESSFFMGVSKSDIKKAYVASNGMVFVTNKVYPPIDYQCAYASTLTSTDTKIMNWAIQDRDMKFYLYLRSMENDYNLLVPTDEAFKNYRDPISWAKAATGNAALTDREIWDFRYMADRNLVYADVYKTDEEGNKIEPVYTSYTNSDEHQRIIRNRLNDIVDMHIVVADEFGFINDGTIKYARTKSGATLKISGSGDATTMTGGGNLETSDTPADISKTYTSDNGQTYFINRILQDPARSVDAILSDAANYPEYKYFYDLLMGCWEVQPTDSITDIFSTKQTTSSRGIGMLVNSFNNFRYTVFVPTQAALEAAFAADPNLWTWEQIDAIDIDREDYREFKKEKTVYLLEFLKYHFIDNSLFINGKPIAGEYETAARNSSGKFRKVKLTGDGTNLVVNGMRNNNNQELLTPASVITGDGTKYNVMARDYIVNSALLTSATQIVASSRAVIHLIDNVLRYE